MPSIAIVGVGRLGGALAIALSRRGYFVHTLVQRIPANAHAIFRHLDPPPTLTDISDEAAIDSEIVLITTPDPEIREAAARIAKRLREDSIVLHTSGSLSSDILADLRSNGASVGSLHPLVSISDPVLGSEKFSGAFF